MSQKNRRQRRQHQLERLRMAMRGYGCGFDAAFVSDIRSAIEARIAVEDFAPSPPARNTNSITVTRNRCHVANHQHRMSALPIQAQEDEDRVGAVVPDHPLKAVGIGVAPVQRWFSAVQAVEIAYQALNA